jgi:DNA-binding response OmpR family regulator
MIPGGFTPRAGESRPRILVVDDDRRVLELLDLAFTSHGFVVITAGDGEEALKQALGERPDLLVLDVRLPRKSGLEVCETLRRDPEEGGIPIILVSAAVETESRLQAFALGADDYLSKPFSPKELIARVKRLLARSAESRDAQRRARQLERELARAQDETRRAHGETRREQRLRELAFDLGRELHCTLDLDELAARFLIAAQARLGSGMVALLGTDGAGGALVPLAVRGDGLARVTGIELRHGGEMETLLEGLARPVLRRDLERFGELAPDLPPLVSGGVSLIAPLRGPARLEGVLLADERLDGGDFEAAQLELVGGLCDIAAVALHNARRVSESTDRMLELLCVRRSDARGTAWREEATGLVERAARAALLPARQRGLLVHGVRIGSHALDADAWRELELLESQDPTGRLIELRLMLERALDGGEPPDETLPDERRAALLLSVGLQFAAGRAAGREPGAALEAAIAGAGEALDAATRQALERALREATESVRAA